MAYPLGVGIHRTKRRWYTSEEGAQVKPFSNQVLRTFREMKRDRLDLHVLFESAGNEPNERRRVLDAVDELVREGLLQSAGGDFYQLTEAGKQAIHFEGS